MRILFTFAGGSGHLEPLLPIASTAEEAGHSVAFVARPWMTPRVEALGFTAFTAGQSNKSAKRLPLKLIDIEQELCDLRDGFILRNGYQRAPDLTTICQDWQPDMIVWEEVDFAAPVIAEHLNILHASVLIIAAGALVRPPLIAEALNQLRAEYDLPTDPDADMLSRYLVLSPFAPSYRDPAFPLPATAHSFRLNDEIQPKPTPAPDWSKVIEDAPVIYVTLGTIFNVESGNLFERLLDALRGLSANVLLTLGSELDPQMFGDQPSHIHIERFVPQDTVLPYCDAVLTHAGSGSVNGALAHGLPMVLLPMGADQPWNAERCEALQVARVLDAFTATPQDICDALNDVLNNPTYRASAHRLRDEIATLPPPAYALGLLERLFTEKQPLINFPS